MIIYLAVAFVGCMTVLPFRWFNRHRQPFTAMATLGLACRLWTVIASNTILDTLESATGLRLPALHPCDAPAQNLHRSPALGQPHHSGSAALQPCSELDRLPRARTPEGTVCCGPERPKAPSSRQRSATARGGRLTMFERPTNTASCGASQPPPHTPLPATRPPPSAARTPLRSRRNPSPLRVCAAAARLRSASASR